MPLAYRNALLGQVADPDRRLVMALQRDLRALGYLHRGIDGVLGAGTRQAVRMLKYDLQHNDGSDGAAPVAMTSFNKGVRDTTDVVSSALADSIEAALADSRVIQLPSSASPAEANKAAVAAIAGSASTQVPIPFLLAIFQQETSGQHYAVPSGADQDNFVVIGLDIHQDTPDRISSRGYGIGQYTLFHHPPTEDEMKDFILDPLRNVEDSVGELRDKFDGEVAGTTAATRADDRVADHPLLGALRLCRYGVNDPKYMKDCKACAKAVPLVNIGANTPLYRGSNQTYGQAEFYSNPILNGVPDRSAFLCDWPYAMRRYNGSGPDSFNYQARVLRYVLAL